MMMVTVVVALSFLLLFAIGIMVYLAGIIKYQAHRLDYYEGVLKPPELVMDDEEDFYDED